MEREPAALHKVFEKPSLLLSGQHSLCAGCGEPLALRTVLEVIHCAARGEKITAIVLNNGVFGETGGHMTATTIPGQKTKTTAQGRDPSLHGHPIRISELVASLDGASYVARGAMSTPSAIAWTQRIVTEAFEDQL